MSEGNDAVNTNEADACSTTDAASEHQATPLNANNTTMERGGNTGRNGCRKRKGMEKMIIVGARASAKCGELIQNPRGAQHRRIRERLFGKVISSIGGNKCKTLLDDGIEKELQSNDLRLEESSAGLPIAEASEETAEVEENVNEDNVDVVVDQEESEDVMFPMDGADDDPAFEESHEEDDGVNDEAGTNIGDINMPADPEGTSNDDANDADGDTQLTYHQKLEAKKENNKRTCWHYSH